VPLHRLCRHRSRGPSVIEARRARNIAPEPGGGRKILGPVGSGHSLRGGADPAEPMRLVENERTSPVADRSVDSIPNFTPGTVLEQQFNVAHPPEQVFAMFDDIAAIAACLPGASLTAPPKPERVEGEIRVRIVQLPRRSQASRVSNAAQAICPAASLASATIGVAGPRPKANSLSAGADRTGCGNAHRSFYWLYGHGNAGAVRKAGLVQDLAARLIAEFAGNLDRRLSGTTPVDVAPVELSGMSLVSGLLRTRVVRWFGRFSSNKDGAA